MDDELLWEVILSHVGNGSKAAPTAKIPGRARGAPRGPTFTALKRRRRRGAARGLESAARRIGGFLLRRAGGARRRNRGPSKNKYQISRRRSNN